MPDGTTVTMPQGANAKEWRKNITQNVADAQSGKNTESQSKASGFANRMEVAIPDIDKYQSAATGAKDNAIAGIPFVPDKVKNYGLSEQFQLYNSAKGRWISGLLRRDSGAVINADEFAREDKNFFPQPGDPPSVIEQKRRARIEATEAIKREAGLGYKSPSIQQSDGGGWIDLGNGVRVREKR
jgi:flagellar hook-basal body complex protein FliE